LGKEPKLQLHPVFIILKKAPFNILNDKLVDLQDKKLLPLADLRIHTGTFYRTAPLWRLHLYALLHQSLNAQPVFFTYNVKNIHKDKD
jgi:hypothetical protein